MSSIVHSGVEIHLSPEPKAAVPSWFEEVVVMAAYLKEHHLLASVAEQVRFSRARMGRYDLMDFVAVLLVYALSGERSLHDFYQRLADYGELFMALFERARLPHRCTLSRFLAALTPDCVELLRQEVLTDLAARRVPQQQEAGWWDRRGKQWLVFDVDGTRAVARQRALPQAAGLPVAHRRHTQVCAAGYTGRKRGEVVRTRTTVLHGATSHWIGTFSGNGNGDLHGELGRALQAITRYAQMHDVPPTPRAPRRRVGSNVSSTIVPGCAFPQEWSAASSLPAMRRRRARLRWGSAVKEGSMNSFTPTCRKRALWPAMYWRCICIVGPLRWYWPTKIKSKTLIAGALTPLWAGVLASPLAVGLESASGSGTAQPSHTPAYDPLRFCRGASGGTGDRQ